MTDTSIDPAQISDVIDAATGIAATAPSLYAVLQALGPLVEATEDAVPQVWVETLELRRSEKAQALRLVAVAATALGGVLNEVESGGLDGAAHDALQHAVQAFGEVTDRLTDVAGHLESRERRT